MQINFSQSNITVAELADLAHRHNECIISNGGKGYKVVPIAATRSDTGSVVRDFCRPVAHG